MEMVDASVVTVSLVIDIKRQGQNFIAADALIYIKILTGMLHISQQFNSRLYVSVNIRLTLKEYDLKTY